MKAKGRATVRANRFVSGSQSRLLFATIVFLLVHSGYSGDIEAKQDQADVGAVAPAKGSNDRTEEMLSKMRSAVEEIAELYGDPPFVQIFTNNKEKADELRDRLKETESLKKLRVETAELAAKRDKLANEITLREGEIKRLSDRLAKQRTALDAVAGAIEATNRAIENSAP